MAKRHTARKRATLIELVRTSGSPIKVVAEKMGVSVSTAYLWMRQAPAKPMPTFARVVPASSLGTTPRLAVEVGGGVIQLEPGFDAELLRQVVAALSRVPT
jgi:transposase-like protein